MTTALHEERLAAVLAAVAQAGARTVIDLGCGEGDLIVRLAQMPGIARVTGIEIAMDRLRAAEARLGALPEAARDKVQLACASLTQGHPALRGYDCACLVEVIEHLPPGDMNRLERAVFAWMRPARVIVTTPNADYNPVLGVPPARMRHPGHRFEWGRARFARWAGGVAARTGYEAACRDICGAHPRLGGASQMAVFTRLDA